MPPASPRTRWLVFGLLALAYLLVYFHRLSPAVVAVDLMRDLEAGGALIGLLASAYFYPYALMQLPAGLLSDSWGPRRTITVFFLLAGAASIFFGLAPTAGAAILARVLVGLGVSMLFVPTMKVLTRWFRRAEFAFMTGILMAVGGLGSLSAAGPLAYLSGLLGWRGSFVSIGAATLILAGIIWLGVRDRPEEMGLPPLDDPAAEPGDGGGAISLGQGMKMVLRRAAFWPLAVWFFFDCTIAFSFAGLWGGPYLIYVYGLTRVQAGHVLSMFAVGMILGSPYLSFLSDRVFHSRKKVLVGGSSLLLLLTLPLAFFPAGLNLPLLYALCLLLGVSASAVVVVGFAATKELFPVEIAGTATGLVNLFPFLGGAVMQPVVGLVLEAQGRAGEGFSAAAYGTAFRLYVLAALITLGAAALVKETLPARERV